MKLLAGAPKPGGKKRQKERKTKRQRNQRQVGTEVQPARPSRPGGDHLGIKYYNDVGC